MRILVGCGILLLGAVFAVAEPVTPGEIHMLKDGDMEINAKPGDVVVARIPNPVLAKRVTDLDIKTMGGVKLAGAVNAEEIRDGKSVPGGSHIKIYLSVVKGARSGSLEFSYKNGAGEEHKRKVVIQIADHKE